MVKEVMIVDCEGHETRFGVGCNLNFDREKLLVTAVVGGTVSGWHWDRFACIVKQVDSQSNQPGNQLCELGLRLGQGGERTIRIENLHGVDLKPLSRLLVVEGAQATAYVNMDHLNWYHTHS